MTNENLDRRNREHMTAPGMRDITKATVTAIAGILVGALLTNMLDSRSMETRLSSVEKQSEGHEPRLQKLENSEARMDQRVSAIESKVDDIWRVTVLRQTVSR